MNSTTPEVMGQAKARKEEADRLNEKLRAILAELEVVSSPAQAWALAQRSNETRADSIALVHAFGAVLTQREQNCLPAEKLYWEKIAAYIVSSRELAVVVWKTAHSKHVELRHPVNQVLAWWYAFRRMVGFPVDRSTR